MKNETKNLSLPRAPGSGCWGHRGSAALGPALPVTPVHHRSLVRSSAPRNGSSGSCGSGVPARARPGLQPSASPSLFGRSSRPSQSFPTSHQRPGLGHSSVGAAGGTAAIPVHPRGRAAGLRSHPEGPSPVA